MNREVHVRICGGGEGQFLPATRPSVNGYGPGDPEAQAEIEQVRPETEAEPRYQPRIYAADLTSQERGITHGLWIDANQEPDELQTDIAAMLESSPTVGANLWAVSTTEDFAGLDLHGYTDTILISLLAKGIAEHGPAYSAWVTVNGTDDRAMLERFDDFYIGSYESREAWMRDVADDLGWQQERKRITDPLLQPYVVLNYAAMAEDAERSWDAVTGIDGRLYVFMR